LSCQGEKMPNYSRGLSIVSYNVAAGFFVGSAIGLIQGLSELMESSNSNPIMVVTKALNAGALIATAAFVRGFVDACRQEAEDILKQEHIDLKNTPKQKPTIEELLKKAARTPLQKYSQFQFKNRFKPALSTIIEGIEVESKRVSFNPNS
jgi:hypothetical protein